LIRLAISGGAKDAGIELVGGPVASERQLPENILTF